MYDEVEAKDHAIQQMMQTLNLECPLLTTNA